MDPARAILQGEKPTELPEELVKQLRGSFLKLAGSPGARARTARANTPLCSEVFAAWGANTEDPDSYTLAEWLDHGAPLGFSQAIKTNGIFPKVLGEQWTEEQRKQLVRSMDGWENYQSAIDENQDLQQLVSDYVERGFCHLVPDVEHATRELGSEPVVNRLGVVVKYKGEKKKSRIIWDLRESGANLSCSQGERVLLPRLLDLGQAGVRAYKSGRTPWLAGIDIKDAFMNIPAGQDKRMTVSAIPTENGEHQLVVFDTLVFGSASSPTLWGRFAAWLGRTLVCIEPEADVQIYVDDPGFVLVGELEEATRQLTKLLLWVRISGFPIKLEKASGGKSMEWVGATLTLKDLEQEVEISVPTEKVRKLTETNQGISSKPVVGARILRAHAGGLSFLAGLVPHVRPFLGSIWAALGSAGKVSDGQRAGKLIHTRRIKPALEWLGALLAGEPAPLVRTLHSRVHHSEAQIVTDACPFGMGAILRNQNEATEYFMCDIPTQALSKFRARRGELLIAFRMWLPQIGFYTKCWVKSDSLSTLLMLAKGKAKSPELNYLAREFALDQALKVYRVQWLEHIPGVTNIQADALSRMFAPTPAQFPESLHRARQRHVAVDEGFWKVQPLPRAAKNEKRRRNL